MLLFAWTRSCGTQLPRDRVVLAAGEHAPEQAGELAGAGNDRDLVATAGADALIEGAQRAGLTHGAPGGFDEGVASVG